MVKTLCFHCRRCGYNSCMPCGVAKKKKNYIKKFFFLSFRGQTETKLDKLNFVFNLAEKVAYDFVCDSLNNYLLGVIYLLYFFKQTFLHI